MFNFSLLIPSLHAITNWSVQKIYNLWRKFFHSGMNNDFAKWFSDCTAAVSNILLIHIAQVVLTHGKLCYSYARVIG